MHMQHQLNRGSVLGAAHLAPLRPRTASAAARRPAAALLVVAVAAPPRPSSSTSGEPMVVPLKPEHQAVAEAKGYDMSVSGLKFIGEGARERALAPKANKVEKIKNKKDGSRVWADIEQLAEVIRSGEAKWEDLAIDDIDVRLKWAGLFHRKKRTPGKFMMRLKVPNGELSSEQLRFLGDAIKPYGADGCGDITTRANIQLRGITLAEADTVFAGLQTVGLSSVSTGMDSVRNMTVSPISGIDPHEILDCRALSREINAQYTNDGRGNEELTNLPRKINIALSGSRDDFPHTHINDVGLVAVRHPDTGEFHPPDMPYDPAASGLGSQQEALYEVGFNLEVGGYFSIKRNAVSFWGDTFVRQEQVVPYCMALLRVFRDYGGRLDRQKARLIWLVEDWGVDKFRDTVAGYMGDTLAKGVHVEYDDSFPRRDVLGIHPQKQPGLFWVGACVPAGRLTADDFHDFADIAEKYGDGSVRLTVEQNVLFPNIPEQRLDEMRQEPLFRRYHIEAAPLTRGLVSCTGAQFCGIALIETKQRAVSIVEKLEAQLDIPLGIRMHWTGCPNSCGQAQVADIGLMGCPAKKDGKAVEGVRIFLGGSIGENAQLASEFEKGIPCDEDILLPRLRDLLIDNFGATPKQLAAAHT